ncbi:hypothetical protein VCHA53O466_50531 [Vibrio chagasii]|nr:hypothetical protein VCHA53O466_50531 [Vibrio chagasii]
MDRMNQCIDWLESQPDVEMVKTKLEQNSKHLLKIELAAYVMSEYKAAIEAGKDGVEGALLSCDDGLEQELQKWCQWLASTSPDLDYVTQYLADNSVKIETYSSVIDHLNEYLGDNTNVIVNPPKAEHKRTQANSEGGDYSLSFDESEATVYDSQQDKLTAFNALKASLGCKQIVTSPSNRSKIKEDAA